MLNYVVRLDGLWKVVNGLKNNGKIDDLFAHNREELNRWILRIRNALLNGKLKELVEVTSLHNPRVSQILYHSTQLLIDKGAKVKSNIRSNDLSLNHPAIDFQDELSDYEPPAKNMVLLILPCSAKKTIFQEQQS